MLQFDSLADLAAGILDELKKTADYTTHLGSRVGILDELKKAADYTTQGGIFSGMFHVIVMWSCGHVLFLEVVQTRLSWKFVYGYIVQLRKYSFGV